MRKTEIRKGHEEIDFTHSDFKLIVSSKASSTLDTYGMFHQAIEIKYFYEGSTSLLVNDDIIIAQAGDIVIVNPYEIHSTIDLKSEQGKYHLFMIGLDFFEDTRLPEFDLRYLLIRKQLRFGHLVRKNERMQYILKQIVKEVEDTAEYYELVVRGLLLEFFALLMRDDVMSVEKKSGIAGDEMIRQYMVIEPALQKIRDCYQEKLTTIELAKLCNVSRAHFIRIFKKVTNMTVVEYITDYRFKVANLLMMHSESSIAEVAEQCGFNDESYFCRCYKKKFGTSPNKNKVLLYQK